VSAGASDEDIAPPLPRESSAWFGHDAAEQMLLDAYRGGRVPHAWLIGGQPGIGKATLAYRMARFLLAHPDPASPDVQSAQSLALASDHRVVRQVAAQAHPDLLVLERTLNERDTLRTVITVEDVRRTIPFFGSTPGEGGWRVVIVDAADELNAAGANSLLKLIEEPPPRALFLIVSHAPGRLLPTIRSRCRRLLLRPLAPEDVARAAAFALGANSDDPEIRKAAAAAGGSVGQAIAMLGGPLLVVRERVIELLGRLPSTDPRALHALGESLERADRAVLTAFVDTVRDWLSARLAADAQESRRLGRLAEVWDKVNRAARDTEIFNLERKPLVFNIFGWLAEASRG
jgi:DNA polymerase III subunit delta'